MKEKPGEVLEEGSEERAEDYSSNAKIPLSASGIASNFASSLAAGGQISDCTGSNKLCVAASGDCCLLRKGPRGRTVCPPSC